MEKEFRIIIEETISQEFIVKAKDLEEAEEIATENYDNGVFVLEPGEVNYKQMQIRDNETNEETEWFQF